MRIAQNVIKTQQSSWLFKKDEPLISDTGDEILTVLQSAARNLTDFS